MEKKVLFWVAITNRIMAIKILGKRIAAEVF